MKNTQQHFKTFPEFSELTLALKDDYETIIKEYPPISSISFPDLMVWWSAMDSCKISMLNENLVIAYWMPGDEKNTGLSLIGNHKIDESICMIFDHLKKEGKLPKLVHVPEFVIGGINYPELYKISEERDQDECIISPSAMASFELMSEHRVNKIKRYSRRLGASKIEIKDIDLSNLSNQELLVSINKKWQQKGPFNGVVKHEIECLERTVWYADELGVKCVGIFINHQIYGFILYKISHNPQYALAYYARFIHDNPDMFEFAAHEFAKWFSAGDVEYINIQEDLGIALLRVAKVGLEPVNFFRKYTVEPRDQVHKNDVHNKLKKRKPKEDLPKLAV